MADPTWGEGGPVRRTADLVLGIIERLGVPIAVLLGVLIWFVAVDAGWIASKPREAVTQLGIQNTQLQQLTFAVAELTKSVSLMNDQMRAQARTQRELWCWAVLKDREQIKQCMVGGAGGP